ncbi:hypothetical protein ACIBBE_42940 [Streptomyces sp. NPDC051644]|uniref:hypothetical protein n=1 Tax=Streptomyces sp. NPDC051644 TaxID=3365666 RepID=UPI0037AF0193
MSTDDDALREERQAAALRRVADLGAERARHLKAADDLLEPLGKAVGDAARLNAPRRRTQELAQVGSGLFYQWLKDAGIDVRPKKSRPERISDE